LCLSTSIDKADLPANLVEILNMRHNSEKRIQSSQATEWKATNEFYSADSDGEMQHGGFRISPFPEYLNENLQKGNNSVPLLGAQIFSRLVFTNELTITGHFQTRMEYNVNGPAYIQN
jgi:hypothetical protein